MKRIKQDGQNVKYSVIARVSGHISPVANKRLYQILAEGGFVVKYVKCYVTSPPPFFRNDLIKMLIFCFDDNLNFKVEGLILRNSPEMYRRYIKGRPLTFTAGPLSTVCVFLAMPYMHSHAHCFVVNIYGLDRNLIVMAT